MKQATLALPLLLAAVAACQTTEEMTDTERINYLVTHGQYDEAVRAADRYARNNPESEEAQGMHRFASVAWRLAAARRLTFDDHDVEALEILEEAEREAPEAEIVQAWLDKTKRKLGARWLNRGLELHADEKLEGAIEAYSKALEYQPGDISALNGMAQAVIRVNYRKGLSEGYYNQGMRAMNDYWLQQARSRFEYSEKYGPGSDRTGRRLGQVEELLADERVVIATGLERDMLFGAARNEFKLALALDPEDEEAQAGLDRTEIEAKAAMKLDEARMLILRGNHGRAKALIAEGLELTTRQTELFQGALAEIEESFLEGLYEEAVNLEKDYLYAEAIAAYGRIVDHAQYYKDVLTRRSTLEEYIRRANELYTQAEQTDEGTDRLELLQQIEIFWPDYRDIGEQMTRLRRQL